MCLNVVTIISFLKKLTYLLYGQPTSTIDVFSNNAVMFLLNCMRLYIFPHEVFWQKGISCSSPHRHPEQTDLAVERRQPNKTNQKSVSLHVPGLSCHMKSSSTILFFLFPFMQLGGKKRLYGCQQQRTVMTGKQCELYKSMCGYETLFEVFSTELMLMTQRRFLQVWISAFNRQT